MNTIEYVDFEKIEAIFMSIDFEKAFDCLNWGFLEEVLNLFNFGESLQRWIKIFYNDVTSCVINNGHATNFFQISRGLRQGCPLSPYLFILAVEILAICIRNDEEIEGIRCGGEEFKLFQYADDTGLLVLYSEPVLRRIINTFKDFQVLSGLKVNFDKTQIMPIGAIKNNFDILLPETGIKWTTEPVPTLGIKVSNSMSETIQINYSPVKGKIKNMFNIWSQRNLTIYGKVTVVKSHVVSKLVYLMSVLPDPEKDYFKSIQNNIFNYMWNNKPDRIKRSIMYSPKFEGGLKVTNLTTQNKSLKISWIIRMKDNPAWEVFVTKQLGEIGELFWECNLHQSDTKEIHVKFVGSFVKDIIDAWCEYNYYTPKDKVHILNQLIWLNSFIKIDKKVVLYNSWLQAGVIYIKDLIDANGSFLEYGEFCTKYNLQTNRLLYYGIIHSIPNPWKKIIKDRTIAIHEPGITKLNILQNKDKVSRYVYDEMIQKISEQPLTALTKWNQDLHKTITLEQWLPFFSLMYKIIGSTKYHYFQFRLLHRTLVTNEKLFQWKIKDSDICTFCKEDIETIKHIFIECEVIKIFWKRVLKWIESKMVFKQKF